ncbi:unnamed protein product [Vitrella brassicaformis CCMP3155]|uniref:Uncharacterized protein n=1 Tax=Vitrella brassicaformis (strain CCMP3155) TaxID=1169540 RepID=A0A0G4GCT1_VITBC|nr:unnamed protein product [Vitrella brassicaformis CCMP3155]|eukprot:CEM27083.1 unnamed protein product [Vitrella brassicaformis CCMP3155]
MLISSGHVRPTTPPRLRLRSLVISKAAHSEPTRQALIAQINDDQNREGITSTVLEKVKEHMDGQLVAKGLTGIIALSPHLTSIDLLLQLAYFIDHSGDWAATVPIIRLAKHRGRVERRLPIEVGNADVEGVGSRAVFDGRCAAMRQLSLIQRHLGVRLERDNNGEERLNGCRLTIRTLQTLPADSHFRDIFDPAKPVCEIEDFAYASLRDAVLYEISMRPLPWGESRVAAQDVWQHRDTPGYERLHGGGRTPPARDSAARRGDQPDHTFKADISINSINYPYVSYASAQLYTTERPVDGKKGAARFPETVRVAQQVMGADAQVAFGSLLAVAVD